MPKPFQTEQEARTFALDFGGPPEEGWAILSSAQNAAMLTRACEVAGVPLGAYDKRILDWLGGFEDSVCGVIAGLIVRAAAGERAAIQQLARDCGATGRGADGPREPFADLIDRYREEARDA
jgi:hypothetical protein